MSNMDRLAQDLSEALKTRRRQPKPYDTRGIVKSIRDGVAYVHFYGGTDETPVALTIDAHVGDEVMVHSGGGRAYIIGNATAPPTDDREAVVAKSMAKKADERAVNANVKADEAKEVAENAENTAVEAVTKANGSVASDTLHYLATSYSEGVSRADSPSTYGTWSTSIQTMTEQKRYLWTYHTYHKASGQSVNTDPVITGVYGQKGATITGIVEYYAVSATNEPPADSAFTPNVIQPTASTPYLWNMEVVTFSDGTSNAMGKHILMTYNQGTEGRGIASVTEYYARNNSTTAPADSEFGTAVVAPTAQNKYLWNYEVIVYTDGLNPTKTAKRIIGTYGEKGDKGDTGDTGHSPVVTASKSGDTTTIMVDGTTIATILDGSDGSAGHSPTITTTKSGKTTYIYSDSTLVGTVVDGDDGSTPNITASRTGAETKISVNGTVVATINDGTDGDDGNDGITYTPSVSAAGVLSWTNDGGRANPTPRNIKGDTGVGVASVQPQYYLSTSSQSATGGTWGTSLTYETGKYIWTREFITYDDGSTDTSTALYNAALTDACKKSEDALNLAEGVDEHFWYDNTGAHVTQATQEVYEDDPSTAGGNLLMTSQGMAVRNGTTELASFTGTQAQIGKNNQFHVVIDDSSLEFNNGSGNTFDIEAFYRDGVDGGRIIKKVDALNQASLGVQSDGRYSDARLYASFDDDGGTYGSQSAYIDVSADMDYSAKVSLHASDTPPSGTAKSAYADLTTEKFETTVPIVAPNIDSGTTDSSGNIAASGNYTFNVSFSKTFPSVPSVVCSLVDVSSNAYQFVVSVANITTTGCDIKIHNNGTQPRSCKVSWIAMSN